MKKKYDVVGMTCSACSAHVDKAVRGLDGVDDVNVNLLQNSMTVEFNENKINELLTKFDSGDFSTSLLNQSLINYKTKYGTNTFLIQDGKVKMEEADCPDGICTDHTAISRKNETIVCLPHKMVISVDVQEEEGQTTEAFDVIAQ